MNLDDLKYICEFVLASGIGGAVSTFFSSYFARKGSLLADKEEAKIITDITESAKSPYAIQLEQVRVRHQLKTAALDKRLQAHQEAFSYWARMNKTPYGEEFKNLHVECSNWWDENCLYLDPSVRSEFLSSITAMNQHHLFIQCGQVHFWTFSDTEKLFNAITEATLLPPMKLSELAIITKQPEK